jgi:hypothetical protein
LAVSRRTPCPAGDLALLGQAGKALAALELPAVRHGMLPLPPESQSDGATEAPEKFCWYSTSVVGAPVAADAAADADGAAATAQSSPAVTVKVACRHACLYLIR